MCNKGLGTCSPPMIYLVYCTMVDLRTEWCNKDPAEIRVIKGCTVGSYPDGLKVVPFP